MGRIGVSQRTFRLLVCVACFLVSTNSFAGKKRAISASESPSTMSWSRDKKLTWDDFRGSIPQDADDVTAAATYCGIGFETNTFNSAHPEELKVTVYNTFYLNDSWARPEERNQNVLAHEQGHFDLCELYTRKLRQRMSQLHLNLNTLKSTLANIYEELQEEYRREQEVYENETRHGLNLMQQKNWQTYLERALGASEDWAVN